MSTSALLRYQKPGGFRQLLSLIETFGPQKREKFLEMIEAESKPWAVALRERILTMERVFTWPDESVVRIFKRMPVKSLAYAISALRNDQKARVQAAFSHSDLRRMEDVMSESKPTADEIASIFVKAIEIARQMLTDGEIQPQAFDPGLMIPEDFERKLDTGAPVAANVTPAAGGDHSGDLLALQRKYNILAAENKQLKDELGVLRSKLENIRKLSA